MTNPLFKILKVDKVYSNFDRKVKIVGWLNGCKWLLKNLEIKYNKIQISKGAVIVYANHPTGLDPYLLTASLERDDAFFWGDMYQSKKGKSVSKHIIPIAPKPLWSILRRPITNWPGYIYMRLTTPSLTRKDSRKINMKAIQKTIDLLKKGKLIIIFPSGGEYEWLSGGRGLKKIKEKVKEENLKVKFVKLRIKNFGELGLFFHFLFKTKIKAKILI